MKQLNFSYLKLNDGLLNKKLIKTTTEKDDVRILKSLLKSISKETYSVPTRLQEIKYCNDISLTTSKSRGEFKIFYDGYAENQIVINLAHGVLRMEYNGGEILSQYCSYINKHDIEIMIKVFGILKDIQTLQDARNSKMFEIGRAHV